MPPAWPRASTRAYMRLGSVGRDGDADAAESALRERGQAAGERIPGGAAVGGFEEAAVGAGEGAVFPGPLLRLPEHGVDGLRDCAGRRPDRWRRCVRPCRAPSARSGRHRWSGRRRAPGWARRGGRGRRRRGGWDCAGRRGWRESAGRRAGRGGARSCRRRWICTCRRRRRGRGAASPRRCRRR